MHHLRSITSADLDLVCRHRQEMFREAGRAEAELIAMASPFRHWLAEQLASDGYFGVVAEIEGRPAGAIGLMVIDWPPHPDHPAEDRRGYVLNVFVEPEHRGRGIARSLMQAAEISFAERGVSWLILHATEAGRPLYQSLGWSATSEMAKQLSLD
jgi:ribosomal protein S18 acetylase RimI-like enzyme